MATAPHFDIVRVPPIPRPSKKRISHDNPPNGTLLDRISTPALLAYPHRGRPVVPCRLLPKTREAAAATGAASGAAPPKATGGAVPLAPSGGAAPPAPTGGAAPPAPSGGAAPPKAASGAGGGAAVVRTSQCYVLHNVNPAWWAYHARPPTRDSLGSASHPVVHGHPSDQLHISGYRGRVQKKLRLELSSINIELSEMMGPLMRLKMDPGRKLGDMIRTDTFRIQHFEEVELGALTNGMSSQFSVVRVLNLVKVPYPESADAKAKAAKAADAEPTRKKARTKKATHPPLATEVHLYMTWNSDQFRQEALFKITFGKEQDSSSLAVQRRRLWVLVMGWGSKEPRPEGKTRNNSPLRFLTPDAFKLLASWVMWRYSRIGE